MQDRVVAGSGLIAGPMLTETYRILPGRVDAGLVLLCDHAENAFPTEYGTLGLPSDQLQRHIAYDIGAAAVTEKLSALLGVPAILSRYSRLLIDLNRGADDPTLIMRISDGAVVPGNRQIDATEREKRVRFYYQPYHRAVDELLDNVRAHHPQPALLSVHSFTEVWRGDPRPWHTGILWDADDRLAKPLIDALVVEGDLLVGDNEPYTGRLEGDCMWQHGTMRGLPHAIIEIRQDLIRERLGQEAWAERLARIVREIGGIKSLGLRLNFEP